MWVGQDLTVPFAQLNTQGLKEALGHSGVNVVVFDNQNKVDQMSRGIGLAIAQKVDVIIDDGVPGIFLRNDYAKAKAAGIKIIDAENGDPGPMANSQKNCECDCRSKPESQPSRTDHG